MAEELLAPAGTPSLWDLTRYYLRLGALGFGGPVALAGEMRLGWVSEPEFVEGLAVSQTLPDPLAAQLAIKGRCSSVSTASSAWGRTPCRTVGASRARSARQRSQRASSLRGLRRVRP
jgi:Chromate transporter